MDISAFSDDQFNPADWINSTYRNNGQKETKEIFIAQLVSKLQLYVEQVNAALEESSNKVLSNNPRILNEVKHLEVEVESLRHKMSTVQEEIVRVQRNTGEEIANLERLDNLKTKLDVAVSGLRESDGWGRLVAELEDLIEKNDLKQICEKFNSLQRSLIAQSGLPGQSERELQVDEFKNRIEALISPSVVQCLTSGDVEKSRNYAKVFRDMDRMPQMVQYYRTIIKGSVFKYWNDMVSTTPDSYQYLRQFYDYFYDVLVKQAKWCAQVFGQDCVSEAFSVLADALDTLRPTREDSIKASLKKSSDKLVSLSEFSEANVHLGKLVKKEIDNYAAYIDTKTRERISTSIFGYFSIFLGQYILIEKTFQVKQLNDINIIQSSAAESIRLLETANGKLFSNLQMALKRCHNITLDCAIPGLITIVNDLLVTLLDTYKKAQNQLNLTKHTEQDWSLLQISVSLLQHIGDLAKRLNIFDEEISGIIKAKYDSIKQQQSDSFGYIVKEIRDVKDFERLLDLIGEREKAKESSECIESSESGIFKTNFGLIKTICNDIYDLMLSLLVTPMEKYIKKIKPDTDNQITDEELPDFSLAPQEYITQVGQYLLMLPQHLEPLLLNPSVSLKTALQISDTKYTTSQHGADLLLSVIVEEISVAYQNKILKLSNLGQTSAKQIAVDIEYFGSVLDDIGLLLSDHLKQIAQLLRLPADRYLSSTSGCDPRLVTAIRQMRSIMSTE